MVLRVDILAGVRIPAAIGESVGLMKWLQVHNSFDGRWVNVLLSGRGDRRIDVKLTVGFPAPVGSSVALCGTISIHDVCGSVGKSLGRGSE